MHPHIIIRDRGPFGGRPYTWYLTAFGYRGGPGTIKPETHDRFKAWLEHQRINPIYWPVWVKGSQASPRTVKRNRYDLHLTDVLV